MLQKCSKCHYPINHPFGLVINESGCSGCYTHKEKYSIDWMGKKNELDCIVKKYKNKKNKYDCVVPIQGDAEDYFTISKVLELGLSPLVVCVNDYFKNDIGWHNLHQLITYFDVDSFIYNPDIRVYKDLIRTSLRKYDHVLLPFLQLHTSFPVHIAYERKIPLIIWGQNQAVEQVGKFSHNDTVEMSRWSRRQHDLFNTEVDTLIGSGAQVDIRNLNYYQYPNIKKLSANGVVGIYLSNYMPWDPLAQNNSSIEFGFKPEMNHASFDIYERAGSSIYYNLHDLLKYKRIGYRKISDHVAREIRHGRIGSDEGDEIVKYYSNSRVDIKPFFDWLGVSESGYDWFKLHKLKGLDHLIGESENTEIILPDSLRNLISDSSVANEKYITFGKGI
tara:strand:- start:7780 stop:8949 length:1170 start_codon:yes stop_codon:yes gene_type:complete